MGIFSKKDMVKPDREELEDFTRYINEVLEFGAMKHGELNWKLPNGKKSSHEDMHNSMFHHIAQSYAGTTHDKETGFHPLAHAACRCLMQLYRINHNLIHKDDKG
jgi:hypothetical protein